jgi:hypothetical protein
MFAIVLPGKHTPDVTAFCDKNHPKYHARINFATQITAHYVIEQRNWKTAHERNGDYANECGGYAVLGNFEGMRKQRF